MKKIIFSGFAFTIVLMILYLSPYLHMESTVYAQDPIECPPGFFWSRMSGVGCQQEDCFDVGNSRYSYTGSCICNEGYTACTEPVDYDSFDGARCYPFCPSARVVACVTPDTTCPGEGQAPVAPVESETEAETSQDITADSPSEPADLHSPGEEPSNQEEVSDLVIDFEEWMTAGKTSGPSPERAAAAGAATCTLIGVWVLINSVSGENLDDLLQALKKSSAGKTAPTNGKETLSKQIADDTTGAEGVKIQQAGKIPLQTSGKLTVSPDKGKLTKPATAQQVTQQATGTSVSTPPQTVVKKPPDKKADLAKDSTKAQIDMNLKLKNFTKKFNEVVNAKIDEGYYVQNRNAPELIWNRTTGWVIDQFKGRTSGRCQHFADWGKGWIEKHAKDIFGDGVIVDKVHIEERSSDRAQMLLNDPIEWADSCWSANHAATRVVLPNGESYIVDFWQAVKDRHYEKASDLLYDAQFGGKPKLPEAKLIKESNWIRNWSEKVGEPGDPAVAHNLNFSQEQLKNLIKQHGDEGKAFEDFRKINRLLIKKKRKTDLNYQQIETIINNWKKEGVHWGRISEA